MRLILFICLLFFVSAENIAQNITVDFKIKNFGMYVSGSFNKVKVTSNFDKDNLAKSYINATIKVSSITTNNSKRDKHLLSNDFFDAAKYATIKLESTKIEKISENRYRLKAKLIIKKTTKNIVIPLDVYENDNYRTIKYNFKLNRRDYGVGSSSWVMSNTVKIQIVYTSKK